MQQYFVAGIGTDVGKTIVSSVLVEKLQADYWKPVQAGNLDDTDSILVKSLISNDFSTIHPEAYRFALPASPHFAASEENVYINISNIKKPDSQRNMLVEGAGGLLVPLNNDFTVLDLIEQLKLPVLLVSKHYLGSINHTLLSIFALKQRQIPIKGIIFNGNANPASEEIILKMGAIPCLGTIPFLPFLDKKSIAEAGKFVTI